MTFYKLFLVFWCIILTTITIFLYKEFSYFRQQAYELSQLKDEYSTYVLALKKLISEYDTAAQSQISAKQKVSEQKKKPEEQSLDKNLFCAVNREWSYLRESASAFARKESLQESVKELYILEPEYETLLSGVIRRNRLTTKRISSKRSPLRRKKVTVAKPLTEQLKKLQREAVFILPIDKANFWLSSLYGPRKKLDDTWGFHNGIDMAAIKGTPVKAAGSGVVIQASFMPGYGNTIVIAHNRKYKTRYAHLSAIKVHVGQHVDQGDLIGKVGATGTVRKSKKGDGSHLHFEVYVFGKQQNPFYYLQH